MRFSQPIQLMIDEKTQGFLEKVQNNDYELYVQKEGYWEPVYKITQLFSQKRYKGVRHRAIFTVIVEKADVLLRNNQPIEGEVTIEYVLRDADKLLDYQPSDLQEAIFSDIKRELRQLVREMESANPRIELESQLEDTVMNTQYGYELKIKTSQVLDLINATKARLSVQAVIDEYALEFNRQKAIQQIQLDYQRLMAVEKAKLELEAEHIRRLRLIDDEMADRELQRLFAKMSHILNLPPELIPAAAAIADPQAGGVLAQILREKFNTNQKQMLFDWLDRNQRSLESTGTKILPPPSDDPITSQLQTISGVRKAEKISDGYRITFGDPPYYVELKVRGNKVNQVLHGSTAKPRKLWTGELSGDIVTVARRVVSDLQAKGGQR